jgi:electron transport complex protein RnfC
MMGVALAHLDYPILKSTGGFLFLDEPVTDFVEGPCIRCARCVDTCPMNLLPLEYVKHVKNERYESLAGSDIDNCIECGCCAYICPSKIPIVQYIKVGKNYASSNK